MMVQWSHSSLKDYENCARSYHEIKVLKRYKKEQIESAKYGDLVHKAAEAYTTGTPLPDEYKFLKPVLDALLSKPGTKHAELKFAVKITLEPCEWMDPYVWARGIADLLIMDPDGVTAWVVDYKTGNDKYADKDQLDLMSLMVFAHYPNIKIVRSALLFLLKDNIIKHKAVRENSEAMWWKYRERVSRIEESMAANIWNPKQTGLCKKHCVVLNCEFNGRS